MDPQLHLINTLLSARQIYGEAQPGLLAYVND